LGIGSGVVSPWREGKIGIRNGADALVVVPALPWVMKEPPSIKTEPIACSAVNFSCSATTASSMANGTCSCTTGAVRLTPISWLDL